MTYQELRERQQKEFNEFPCFYAFSNKQFEEGLKQLDAEAEDLYSGFGGMFYRKADAGKLNAMLRKFDEELTEAFKEDKFLYDAIFYELANHEYCLTLDPTDAFEALGITMDEVQQDDRMLTVFRQAEQAYLINAIY